MTGPRWSRPSQITEAIDMLAEDEALAIAGGVSLVPLINLGFATPKHLVSLADIPELRGLQHHEDHTLIGAMATHTDIVADEVLRQAFPGLLPAFRRIGNIRIRNVGTLGGNLGHADPAQDPPVALAALDADATVVGPLGDRTVPVAQLATGPLEPAIDKDELITTVRIDRPPAGRRLRYQKFLPSSQGDYATVSVASSLEVDAAGQVVHVRLVAGAVGPIPMVLDYSAEAILGHRLEPDVVEACALRARDEVDPSSDRLGSADYKREMVRVLVERSLRDPAEERQ